MKRLALLVPLVAGLSATGCAGVALSLAAPSLKKAADSLNQESDFDFAAQAAPALVKTAEGFLAIDPDNHALLEMVAQGYIAYTFGILEDEIEATPDDSSHEAQRTKLKARATNMYERAFGYAFKALKQDDKHFPDAFGKDIPTFEKELKALDADSVPALFFLGLSIGASVNLNRDDVARVADLPKAMATLKRAYALDKKFFYGAPSMALGTFNCAAGKMLGGDPEAGKKYFEESIAATNGKLLFTKVMYARFCGVITQDRALFESVLKDVLATPPSVFPEMRLLNEIAHRKAKRYLKQVEEFF